MRDLKILTYVVAGLTAGVLFTFAMGIVTAVREKQVETNQAPQAIVTPATSQ